MDALVSERTGSTAPHLEASRVQTSDYLLIGICGAAAILRFATLGIQSYDFDESFTAGIVLPGSLGHVLHTIPITESSPPLYYLLAWLWSRVFGLGEIGLRSFSALCGTLLVPVSYLIGRRLAAARAGLVAAGLVAVNPFLVWYSQEARAYALLALLSALSLLAFLRALEQPTARRMGLWALAAAGALLSHYFAGYLVAFEGLWLILATRRGSAVLASGAVALVAAALVPLVLRQADNRTQWIEGISLPSRIKEVVKKAITGEIAPTHNWQLAVMAVLVGAAMAYGVLRLTERERRGIGLAAGAGAAALLPSLLLDFAGLHYLISKNEMPAIAVLIIVAGVILGAPGGGAIGLTGAAAAAVFFLAITIDGAINPALQRPDYRAAVRALGTPVRGQVVVAPRLGNVPIALYRRGASEIPAAGWPATQVVVVRPLPRADVTSLRAPTPPAPAGFRFVGRIDARTYTLICFAAAEPVRAQAAVLTALAGGSGTPSAQVWAAAANLPPRPLCGAGRA